MRPHAGAIGVTGSLPDTEYLSIASTDNTIFVGSWGRGVYSAPLEEPQFWLLTPAANGAGLQTENVTAVLGGASAGKPWVGTFGGGTQRVDVLTGSSAPTGRDPADSLSSAGIVSIAASTDGSYFAGSTDGLYRFAADGSSLSHDSYAADRKDGIGEGYVVALLPDATGLWVGTGGSGLYRRDLHGTQYRAFRHDPSVANSLSGEYITALALGRAGRLWVGTRSNGLNLCIIEPWSCQRFDGRTPGEHNLANYHVTALHRDGSGALWVATDGGGVHRVNEDAEGRIVSMERWDVARGLLDNGIMAVESDDDGSLWLSTRHGISRLDPATGRVVNYVRESGLPVIHFNTGASSADFRWIFFGSVDGLLSIPRGSAMPVRSPSPLHVTKIQSLAQGTEQPLSLGKLTGGFETRFGDGLAIEFAVLDYAETPHDYAYRLKDTDPWTALGKRRQLTFFGLAPGQYRFEVRGRDAFGNWSTNPAIAFAVVPPFWRTTWFRVLAFSTVVLLALGLHLTRLRALRRRNAVLEQLQRQREHALAQAERSQRELEEAYAGLRQLTGRLESAKEEERSHISRELHDEFGQTLTAAKINLQMLLRVIPDATIAQRLEDSVRMIDGMISQARNIALGLRPPLLDEAGLVAALDHHLDALAGRSGVRIEFDAAKAGVDIPPAMNVTVFRLVQEAVNNALRHAQARTIRVTLCDDADMLRLVVEDDGIGFDREAVAQRAKRGEHLGLLGMTERARSAGGTILLDSSPGSGSRIEVRIPLVRDVESGVIATRTTARRSIVLADDHALVRAGIRALLETLSGVEVVAEYGDGLEALESVRREPPDAILLDITLPGLNGLEVAARITRLGVPTRVLMLSMHNSPEHAARALAAGAAGYLNKDSAFDELATALDAIFSGRRYLCRALNEDVVLELERRAGDAKSELELITPRQRQILQLIAEGHPTRQIAERLFLSIKTVETHRGQIMQRLNIFDVPGLVRFAIRNGLVSSEPT